MVPDFELKVTAEIVKFALHLNVIKRCKPDPKSKEEVKNPEDSKKEVKKELDKNDGKKLNNKNDKEIFIKRYIDKNEDKKEIFVKMIVTKLP